MRNDGDADSDRQMVMASYMIIIGVANERTTVMRTTCRPPITCLLDN